MMDPDYYWNSKAGRVGDQDRRGDMDRRDQPF